jgi:hypothetical protein
VNRFTGSSLVITTISSYTLNIILTVAHVTSHTKPSNTSSGHTAVPLELRNSSEVNSHSRILSYPLGTDHAHKTQHLYCCVAQTAQKTSHVIIISPVHWRADSSLAANYKLSSYCCVTLSEKVFIAPLPIRYNIRETDGIKKIKNNISYSGGVKTCKSDKISRSILSRLQYFHIEIIRESQTEIKQDM